MLRAYAAEHGWDIKAVYSDDDFAGADRNRPEFNRLIKDAQKKKFDIVLCKTQSRFTRELELVEKYIHGLFPIWGIRFVSIVDNADTANKGNKKSRQINGLVNEWYLEDMSENIKSVLTAKRKNGIHIGSFALYGYMKDPDKKGHLIIDEKAANVVREVFTLFSKGYGKTAIARMLNDKKIPNPTEYKRLCGFKYKQPSGKSSTLWKYSAISNMLVNEIYIGNMVQGRYGSISYKTKKNKPRPKEEWFTAQGTHEPVIDKNLWDKVQCMIKEKSKPFLCGKTGLFAGKLRCMNCGYALKSSKCRGKRYFSCSQRYISKNSCIGCFISSEMLEKAVLTEFKKICEEFIDEKILEGSIEFCNNFEKQKTRIKKEIESNKKKISEYSNAIKDLYLDKVKGIITQCEYINFYHDFTNEKKRLEVLTNELKKNINKIDKKRNRKNNQHEVIKERTQIKNLNRETVQKFIEYISVGKRCTGSRNVPVEIHWSF